VLLWPLFLLLGSLNGNFTSDRRGEREDSAPTLTLLPDFPSVRRHSSPGGPPLLSFHPIC
jgi:hypothetical protein